jgi:hypothetical protein
VALTKHGYFIYDDLLNLTPGGWQGGFLPRGSPAHDKNLHGLRARVPIFVLELVGAEKPAEWEAICGEFPIEPAMLRGRARRDDAAKPSHGMKLRGMHE